MAVPRSLTGLLESLTLSLSSSLEVGPKISAIEQPRNGVSLLDTKNEILLSYLQNLVFLILLKLRNAKTAPESESNGSIDDVVNKLTELRLYLEKGVRPLEEKLRFSLENMLRAADDAERKHASKPLATTNDSGEESGEEEDSEEEDSDEDEEDKPRRPQLSGYTKLVETKPAATGENPGVWRASKTRRVVMPEAAPAQRRERTAHKSATMEEYLATELAAGPLAEPSIGTTILDGGRRMTTAKERERNEERREYEEKNFLRLPKESKAERRKQNKASGRSARMEFGGEEWRDLSTGVDRINRLTRQKNAPTGTRALLEKSRKRMHDSTDGPKQSGSQDIGQRFEKRLKVLESGRRVSSTGKRR
ncbi:related to LCP5 - U3 small nucleolar ribonucleoprotein involved in maturation of 18S rRNA [Cephalotrichum gorgonifer]|uniref:Related to LCP5 - U3 small nucleolar ribonucleoprotein involved in maturation of 18S rRNA n=1 Tax=Cephalotrichum gorgonifer TaxID=2041049 RepID=A0AAE8MTS0_9PEZI|nr:related to LCP5 - U3 small nucleolar ribonucleoprotein involved in maturation of 18S rRNA [Cephalotrichum gorgonifer]